MRKLLLLAGFAMYCIAVNAQSKVYMADFTKYWKTKKTVVLNAEQTQFVVLINKQIVEINKMADENFNVKDSAIIELSKLLKKYDTVDVVKSLAASIVQQKLTVSTAAFKLDTIVVEDDKSPEHAGACVELEKVATIIFNSKGDEKYEAVLQDANEKALGKFEIGQLSEELFYSELKKALQKLCSNDAIVNTIIANCKKKPDIYYTFVQDKTKPIDEESRAGTLFVRKNALVHIPVINSVDSSKNKQEKNKPTADATKLLIKAVDQRGRIDSQSNKQPMPSDIATVKATANVIVGEMTRRFTVYDVQIQFQDGMLENIKVYGKMEGDPALLRFENSYPIGFSTKRDYRNLIEKHLYEKSDYIKYKNYYIFAGEFLSYDQNLANDKKDYCPENRVLTIKNITQDKIEIALSKEPTSKILETKVFSDLKGADNNNPNGLIQVELSKRLNFLSVRSEIKSKTKGNFGNYGWLNYITPFFSLNKVEENQKRLVISHIDTLSFAADTSRALTYASTINLLRHQVYSVGFDLSIYLLDIPGLKSTFNFGTGVYFGRTAIQDTLRVRQNVAQSYDPNFFRFSAAPSNNVVQYGVNTFQWGGFLTWQIFPDSRFSVNATQRIYAFKSLGSQFVQVRDSAQYLDYIAHTNKTELAASSYRYLNYDKPLFSKCLTSSEIFAYFKINNNAENDSKIFFRYRLTWDMNNVKENFHQLQVGFSTYLTATKEFEKLKKANPL